MAIMRVGDSLRDRESEPGAAAVPAVLVFGLGRRTMYEAFENPVAHGGRYTGPLIFHVNLHELIRGTHAHVDGAFCRRMLERIVEQIQHETV